MHRAALAALLFLQATIVCGNDDVVARHGAAFSVGAKPVTIMLDVAKAKGRLPRARKVILQIKGVTAAKAPGFIAAVFVGEERVGEVALYAYDQPQTFAFSAGAAVTKALRGGTSLPIHFRPESGLERQPARVEAPIRIAAVALLIERK